MYLDLIKGYRVTIGGYIAPFKEHRENTVYVYVSLLHLVVYIFLLYVELL